MCTISAVAGVCWTELTYSLCAVTAASVCGELSFKMVSLKISDCSHNKIIFVHGKIAPFARLHRSPDTVNIVSCALNKSVCMHWQATATRSTANYIFPYTHSLTHTYTFTRTQIERTNDLPFEWRRRPRRKMVKMRSRTQYSINVLLNKRFQHEKCIIIKVGTGIECCICVSTTTTKIRTYTLAQKIPVHGV